METIPSLQWVKDQGLFADAERIGQTLSKIFPSCLGITDEKILIIGDCGSPGKLVAPLLASAFYVAANSLNLNTKLVFQSPKSKGDITDDDVISSLSDLPEGNIIIVNSSDKLGSLGELGRSFRKFVAKKKHRFLSATSLGDLDTSMVDAVIDAANVDYKPMQSALKRLKEQLDMGKEIHVTTKAGTDFFYDIEGMTNLVSDGHYTEKGTGGNFPSGEVYVPCSGNRVEGKVVLDGSSRNWKHTAIIKTPINLTVEKGSITSIEGGEEAKELQKTLEMAAGISKHPKSVYRVGELGIGMNPKARIIGSTLVDEKTLGTAHIGIGSNYWFGGKIYALIHLDQIFKAPEIELDGKKVDI